MADAYRRVAQVLGHPRPAVLVQTMAPAGVELTAGIVHDPLFGSVVSLRVGGITTDLASAPMLRLVPITDVDAARMWRGLGVAPLLRGYRGGPRGDTAVLEDLMQRLGRLAEDAPEVAELELNPVVVTANGIALVDVKASPRPDRGRGRPVPKSFVRTAPPGHRLFTITGCVTARVTSCGTKVTSCDVFRR